MTRPDFGEEGRRRSRFPQDEERILREEEQALLRDEDRQLMHQDDRGLAVARAGGKCANHPEVEAAAACTECGRQLCPACVFAAGGGHSFCKECMDASRLVDAEPQIIGTAVEVDDPAGSRTALLALILALAVVAVAVALFVALALIA